MIIEPTVIEQTVNEPEQTEQLPEQEIESESNGSDEEIELPNEVAEEFANNPNRKVAYISGNEWFYDKARANKNFLDGYKVVINPHYQKEG